MTDKQNSLRNLLTMSASAVSDVLTAARVDGQRFAFAVVFWEIGRPELSSSVFGSGSTAAAAEAPAALAAAGKKAKGPPTLVTHHTSGRAN